MNLLSQFRLKVSRVPASSSGAGKTEELLSSSTEPGQKQGPNTRAHDPGALECPGRGRTKNILAGTSILCPVGPERPGGAPGPPCGETRTAEIEENGTSSSPRPPCSSSVAAVYPGFHGNLSVEESATAFIFKKRKRNEVAS